MTFSKYSRWLKLLHSGSLLLCLGLFLTSTTQAAAAKEYQIKAAFLYNFVNFIAWPDSVFADDSEPYTICVLGDDPFGYLLNLTTENVVAKNRQLAIKRFAEVNTNDDEELARCHILFISTSEASRINDVLLKLEKKPILTVSEIEDFVHLGGLIQFYTVRNRIRLKINRAELEAAQLKAAGTLLNLANICDRQGCER